MCWNFKDGGGEGFGWDRRTGQRFRTVPPPPGSTRDEFSAFSLIAATLETGGQPSGRILLINPVGPVGHSAPSGTSQPGTEFPSAAPQGPNGFHAAGQDAPRRRFSASDPRWLEQIVR